MAGVKDPERGYSRTPEQVEAELQMMKTPDRWPRWPLLPVKRFVAGANFPEVGCLVDIMFSKQFKIYVGMSPFKQVRLTDTREWPDVVQYHSHEDIVADGWVVD